MQELKVPVSNYFDGIWLVSFCDIFISISEYRVPTFVFKGTTGYGYRYRYIYELFRYIPVIKR